MQNPNTDPTDPNMNPGSAETPDATPTPWADESTADDSTFEDETIEEPDPPKWAGFGYDWEDEEPDEDPIYDAPDPFEEARYMHKSPNGFKTPFYQWASSLATENRPADYCDVPELMYRNIRVRQGQPFRRALEDEEEAGLPLPPTRGSLMLPDSFDPVDNPDLEPETPPGIPMHPYPPGAKAHEILAFMARDMVEVGSVMVARMRVALGYEPDAKMIRLYKELALALSKMYYVTREQDQASSKAEAAIQPKRPPGRPRKSSQTT